MNFMEAMSRFPVLRLRLTVSAHSMLKLPRLNKGNTLRGAFGGEFRRLVCVPECREARLCPLDAVKVADGEAHPCPYRDIFEPAPPKWAGRLSKNQDAPRPFIFRPPLAEQTTWQPGESFDFELLLFGRATGALPWFVLAFRSVLERGFGLNRACCALSRVMALRAAGGESLVYPADEAILRGTHTDTMADWVAEFMARMPEAARVGVIRISFLTPTLLKSENEIVVEPEFHQLFKRVRDRINALSSFYGPGPIEADFAGLGKLAERVRTVSRKVEWEERFRTSSKTGQRHGLMGVEGVLQINFESLQSSVLFPWIAAGEIVHVGRFAVWGFGQLMVSPDGSL